MNLKELWIGERVQIISSGKTGKFAGIHKSGKARVGVGDTILLVANTNLIVLPEEVYYPDIHDILQSDEKISDKKKPLNTQFNHTLDLHIDKLAPHMENELSAIILDFQLRSSYNFIQEAIQKNYPHITLIHGKGQGVLKQAIEHQLKQFDQIRFTFSKNGGGAVEVWL